MRLLVLLLVSGSMLAATITDLRIEQPIALRDGAYRGDPAIAISVTLAKPAEVLVTISRAVAGRSELTAHGTFSGETLVVRTLPKQQLAAGTHTLTWDGLGEDGKALTVAAVASSRVGEAAPAAALEESPVDRFRITVQTGGESHSRTFVRLSGGSYDSNRVMTTFSSADWAPDGTLVVAERPSWRGRRYTANWKLIGTQPRLSLGHESDPVECYDVQVDSHGSIYLLSGVGLYRYGPDAEPQEYSSREAHITFPYPLGVANRLGLRVDPARGTYERASGDGQRSVIDAPALVGKPGFAEQGFAFCAVGDDGTILLGTREPVARAWAFANDGRYLRDVALPSSAFSATFGNNRFYIGCESGLLILDPQLSPLRTVSGIAARRLHVGRDGTVYASNWNPGDLLARFTPEGDPKPFSDTLPNRAEPHQLRLSPEARKLPAEVADACPVIQGMVGGADGDFWIAASITGDPGHDHKRLLHFAADGSYLPETTAIAVLERQPYHVFVEQTPAAIDLLLTDLTTQDAELTATWTLTDFYGAEQQGTTRLAARAGRRQVLALELPAKDFGHYRVALSIARDGQVVFEHACALTRIHAPDLAVDPDSPFAICWAVEPGLAGICGAKVERVGDTYWEKDVSNAGAPGIDLPAERVRPTPGRNDWWISTQAGWRDAFTRWGMQVPGQFTYGEAWLGGSYPNCRIFSYDAWLRWTLATVERIAPSKPPYYQFWNEPNFFWHVPGQFSREHFALVAKLAWCAVKARDKEAWCIADGDAGGLNMMVELGQHGAGLFNDAVQIHYPGVKPLRWDDMTAPEAPESKLDMVRELVALREQQFPGKPIWNTEEGWWGAKDRPWSVGAMALPRIYLSQMVAGVDRIYWFDQMGMAGYGPDSLLDAVTRSAHPTLAAYAQMTHALSGASHVGTHDLGAGIFAHLFVRGDQAVLCVWSGKGPVTVSLTLGTKQVVIADVLGRERTVTTRGALELPLVEYVQYVSFPRNAWTAQLAGATAQTRLQAAGCVEVAAITTQLAALSTADDAAVRQAHHLVQAAEACALAASAPKGKAGAAAKARAALLKREGTLGYLRHARLALSWAERLERSAKRHGGETGARLLWASQCAAHAATALAAIEQPDVPGLAITSFVGEPGEIARIRGTVPVANHFDTTIDEKFRLELQRNAGDTLELELTAWNLTTGTLTVALVPRLPEGWTAVGPELKGSVKPGEFLRGVLTVTVPPGTTAGVYRLDATAACGSHRVSGLHPARVKAP